MINRLNERYMLVSPQEEIKKFIEHNDKTLEILDAIEDPLVKHFPNNEFSLEICDRLSWTSETKLLLNVHVNEEMFFNGMLNHFNDIYEDIEPVIEDNLCPVVLFPDLNNENYDRLGNNCAINLIARAAYFNNDFDENYLREITLREIPKEQKIREIINYCKSHEKPNISDMVFDLQLDLFDVDSIIDELEDEGIDLNVEY